MTNEIFKPWTSSRRSVLRRALMANTALLLAGMASPGFAQSTPSTPQEEPATGAVLSLDEVVVTARRRSENIQDVPAAITAIAATELQSKQVVTQNDLRYIAPSLGIQGRYGHQGGTYAIRGLAGPTSGTASVGTYFAEVPSPQGLAGFDVSAGTSLYDLDSVQVLKGPQGTLFGRTSTAGAVLVTPRLPSLGDYHGSANVTVGSLGRTEMTLAAGGPVIRDVLGVRVALNRNHRDGYTRIIGSGDRLDETDTESYRISIDFQPRSWVRNTTIYDDYKSNSSASSFIVSAYNPGLPSFNLPANTTAFNAVCATAVANGYSPNVATCAAQRLTLLSQIRGELATEVARTAAGGSALRYSNLGGTAPYGEVSNRKVLVNTTTVKLPTLGSFEWQFKNIFGYQEVSGYTLTALTSIPTPNIIIGAGAPGGASYHGQGSQIIPGTGDGFGFYTDEAQFSGSYDRTRLVWVAGYYSQRASLPQDLTGLSFLTQSLGGVSTPTLGYSASSTFPISGRATQKAYYAQATLGFDGVIDRLHLTAGFRHSEDEVTSTTAAAVLNPATGAFSPSPTRTTSGLTTSGDGYTISLDYKVNPSTLIYATTRKGYVPGGLNSAVGNASGLANYSPVFGSEEIQDYEVGAKFEFELAGMASRLNVAYYWEDYSNIQRQFSGFNASGAILTYTANVAQAELSGFEGELQMRPNSRTLIGINYSYNKTGYTEWRGADPLNVAPAGSVLDLSKNPFSNAPKQKLSVNASYDLVVSDRVGTVTISGQGYAQTREWFSANSQRFLDVYGEGLRDAISQPSYAVFNAKLDWTDVMGRDGVTAGLFVRNVGDKLYTSSGLVQLNTVGSATKTYAEPRTYGLNLSYQF